MIRIIMIYASWIHNHFRKENEKKKEKDIQ